MPYVCKICKKHFAQKWKAISHIIREHDKPSDIARTLILHIDPQKDKELMRIERLYDHEKKIRRIKKICFNGTKYPDETCLCVVCHVVRSKSYRVHSDYGDIQICRDCYRNLTAKKHRSIYFKRIYDGNFESNK